MRYLLSIELMAKYPFMSIAKNYISSLKLNLESLADSSYEEVRRRAKERVLEAIERAGRSYEVEDLKVLMHPDPEVELLSFPLSLFIVASLDSDFAYRRFALAEALRAETFLKKERSDIIEILARDEFKMDFKIVNKTLDREYTFAIHFLDYLKEASRFNAKEWKIVNRYVEKGYVYVTQRELARLLRNAIERYILDKIREVDRVKPPDYIVPMINELKERLTSRRYAEEGEVARSSHEFWPPCMKAIHSSIIKGESTSHFANFAFASFLINIGVSVDDIIAIYANRSDFDEKIARYQVEHIAGMRGSRTKYTTPSCSTMQTNGLCIENGRLCGNIRNPLSYVKRKMWRKKQTDN